MPGRFTESKGFPGLSNTVLVGDCPSWLGYGLQGSVDPC